MVENTPLAPVRQTILGMVVPVYVTVVSNTHVVVPDIVEEVEHPVVGCIQRVPANRHIHGRVEHVLVRVLISMLVAEPVIVPVVGQLVVENMRVALVLLNTNGQVVVVIIVEIVINMLVQ